MRLVTTIGVALALTAYSSTNIAGELISGPQVGEKVSGYFDIEAEKCGGIKDRHPVGTKGIRYY